MIRAGILVASDYMGGEALRVMICHPQVQLAWATRGPTPWQPFLFLP
jgi:hypothetical protein